MKSGKGTVIAAAVMALSAVNHVAAADLLAPGLYRLVAGAHREAAPLPPVEGESHQDRFEHAIPDAARVRYAMVSRDETAGLNTLVFLSDAADAYGDTPGRRTCQAYAFPNWNDYATARPFCRIAIGGDDARVAATADGFTIGYENVKRHIGATRVPAVRAPTAEEAGICAIADVCAREAYGSTLNQYEVTHYRDRFVLIEPHAYRDLLFVARPVPMLAAARSSTRIGEVGAGSFVAVIDRDGEGYGIERIAADGTRTRGWLDRDALEPLQWIDQSVTLPGLRFQVGVLPAEDEEGAVLPVALAVLDATTGARRQVLRDIEAGPTQASPDLLQTVDANFDGAPDLRLPGLSGGAGPNATSNILLFDRAQQRFVLDPVLSDLSQLDIDAPSRSILSFQRGGCCTHLAETYRYMEGQLVLVEQITTSLSADGRHEETSTGRLIDGKMVYRTRRTRAR
ncbi:XAC2610-related protein [Stenotrophomonas sp. GZD-301]|uniref:XAC2610-related protein n=1 Tax=Stenotrophomonas sp. GZD-301 TaxID=3404814 RepID=UPI003BB807D9